MFNKKLITINLILLTIITSYNANANSNPDPNLSISKDSSISGPTSSKHDDNDKSLPDKQSFPSDKELAKKPEYNYRVIHNAKNIIDNSMDIKLVGSRVDLIDNVRFYIGIGAGLDRHKFDDLFLDKVEIDNKGSVGLHSHNILIPTLGVKVQDYFSFGFSWGIEGGYNIYKKLKICGIKKGELFIKNVFLDWLIYIPLATQLEETKVENILSLGVGHTTIKEKGLIGAMIAGDSYSKYGLRAKVGMQFNITNNWTIRGLYIYKKVGHISDHYAIKNTQSVALDFIFFK